MKLLKITDAKYVEDYKIDLSFNNGVSAIIDLKDTIFLDHRAIFKQLKEIAFFKDFTQNSWTIEWKNGLDFAPEYLYELIQK